MNWELFAIVVLLGAAALLILGGWMVRSDGARRYPDDVFGVYSYIALGGALVLAGQGLYIILRF